MSHSQLSVTEGLERKLGAGWRPLGGHFSVDGGVDQEKDIFDGEAYQLFQLRYVAAIPYLCPKEWAVLHQG